jgi:hypothetical protein
MKKERNILCGSMHTKVHNREIYRDNIDWWLLRADGKKDGGIERAIAKGSVISS